MGSPKWQKCRILSTLNHPEIVGRECWVEVGPQVLCTKYKANRDYNYEVAYASNVRPFETAYGMSLPPDTVELLPEFADDVPLVDFETWRKQEM